MATRSFSPLLGKRIRVTRLDSCGRFPAPGTPNSQIVTDGFVTVKLSSETEDGPEIIQRKANGQLCINEKFSDSFKHLGLEITFCGVNPSLLAFVSNADEYADYAGDIAGITVADGDITGNFAFEMWTGLAGGGCADGADDASGYLLLPFVGSGVLDDLEVGGEDAIEFGITGAYTKGGNAWGVGPYNVMYDTTNTAAPLPTPLDERDHLLLVDTGLAVPESSEDALPMPSLPVTAGTTTTTTTAPAWKATTAYTVGQTVTNGAATLQVTTAGTSGSTAPTNPSVNSNVTDGSVTWKRIA